MSIRAAGALGLALVVVGILTRNRRRQDVLYIAGGALLLVYSIRLGDMIFILLQAAFIAAAAYDLLRGNR